MNYMDENFDISNIECFNNTDGLLEIGNYLDFAISTTIHKQMPGIQEKEERTYAATLLKNYLNSDNASFTRSYNIRGNISKIGKDRIRFLMYKSLIEQYAVNQRVNHLLNPTEYIDQCAQYITNIVASGKFNEIQDWLQQNMDAFIDEYTRFRYRQDPYQKQNYEQIAIEHPDTRKALEVLNLEMHTQQLKQRSM